MKVHETDGLFVDDVSRKFWLIGLYRAVSIWIPMRKTENWIFRPLRLSTYLQRKYDIARFDRKLTWANLCRSGPYRIIVIRYRWAYVNFPTHVTWTTKANEWSWFINLWRVYFMICEKPSFFYVKMFLSLDVSIPSHFCGYNVITCKKSIRPFILIPPCPYVVPLRVEPRANYHQSPWRDMLYFCGGEFVRWLCLPLAFCVLCMSDEDEDGRLLRFFPCN